MTKEQWIEYMLHIIQPAKGLERACRDLLEDMYQRARDVQPISPQL